MAHFQRPRGGWSTYDQGFRLLGERGAMPDVDTPGLDSSLEQDPGYRLEPKGREAAEDARLKLLEQLFDPGSRQQRALVQPGWRCLEVGAGRGSMAAWLAGSARAVK